MKISKHNKDRSGNINVSPFVVGMQEWLSMQPLEICRMMQTHIISILCRESAKNEIVIIVALKRNLCYSHFKA